MSLQHIIRSLESKNYRLFFTGQSLSVFGTMLTQTAMIWVVYSLTKSALFLGLVGFVSQVPNFIMAPFAGVFIERWNRRNILISTQAINMTISLILAILALTKVINIEQIICLSIFQGLVSSFDIPARYAFINDVIEKKEDISNATALHSSLITGSRIIGPAIAGFLIASLGPGYCFLIDAISYIGVISALLAVEVKVENKLMPNSTLLQKMKEGFTYAFEFLPIRSILMLMALLSFMGMPYKTLLPIFAIQILHGNSTTLGFLMGSSGIGALIACIYLSSRTSVLGFSNIIALAPVTFGAGLIVFCLSHNFIICLIMLTVLGCSSLLEYSSSNAVLQTITEDDKRGRVMSMYTMSLMGTIPFGELFLGGLANKIGAPDALIYGGACCISGGLIFSLILPDLKKLICPVYKKKGIVKK